MASRGTSARRYAEAVFEIAVEGNTLDAWSRDLQTFADFVAEADIARVLASGRVPRSEKLRLLSAGLEAAISPLAMNLARLLESRDKVHLAPGIRDAYQGMADEHSGVAHAVVTTAVPLSDEDRRVVAARLSEMTGKRVDVTAAVDEKIIGGVVARIGDQLIDGSTRTRLVALKRRLAAG